MGVLKIATCEVASNAVWREKKRLARTKGVCVICGLNKPERRGLKQCDACTAKRHPKWTLSTAGKISKVTGRGAP